MLNNMSVRTKFLLLVAIPLIAMLTVDVKQIMSDYRTSQSMEDVVQLAQIINFSNLLIHEVQKERGISAGFVASKGQNFSTEIFDQRIASKNAAEELRQRLAIFQKAIHGSHLPIEFQPALDRLERIEATQAKIDTFTMPPVEIIAFYTALVRDLQAALGSARDSSSDATLFARIDNLMDLISAKEFAGQERATLNTAFAAGSFSPEIYRGWRERVAMHSEYLRAFLEYATGSSRDLFSRVVVPLQHNVEKFRATALERFDKPSLDVEAPLWFASSTAYIDALHDVELNVCRNLQQLALTKQSEANTSLKMSIVATSLLLVLTLFLTVIVVRNVTIPLSVTVNFAGQVAQGNLGAKLQLDRRDELGQLALSLNAMLTALKDIIQEAESATVKAHEQTELALKATAHAEVAQKQAERAKKEGMSDAAGSIETVASQLLAISGNISQAILQAETGAKEQSFQLSSTVDAMAEMTHTVMDVARSSGTAVHAADSARLQAQEGRQTVLDVAVNIDKAMQRGQGLKEAMGQLGKRVQNVDTVLRVISDIADQTNLLALNAAIEAARAGDAGRGFAVVASEVRKLAEKTMDATREVGKVLSGIQKDTEQNIHTVDATVLAMENTNALTQRSGDALDKIVTMVDATTVQIHAIATASEEQLSTSEAINLSVLDVKGLADDTADAMAHATQAVSILHKQTQDLQKLILTMRDA